MADDENTVEAVQRMSANWTGEPKTTDQMVDAFKLFGLARRVEMLNELDTEFNGMVVDGDETSIRRYSKFTTFRREMQDVHHKLRKAGR